MTTPASPARPIEGETRPRRLRALREGYPRSFTIGAAFSVAWSPCIGPILGAVLTLAATSGTAGQGALLLTFYGLGLGVWFVAFAAFFGWISPRLRRLQPHMGKLMVVGGAVFIGVGTLMVMGEFARLNQYFQGLGFFFDQTTEVEQDLTSGVNGGVGPLIAFFGGLVSFLSPCVLPLVPAYLVNIAGEAVVGANQTAAMRRRVIAHSLAFVLGFTLVFAFIGASVGLIGNSVQQQLDTLTRIGGVVLIVFGMQMAGLIHLPYMDRTYQLR